MSQYKILGKSFPILSLSLLLLVSACRTDTRLNEMNGTTMGTYYRILYIGEEKTDLQSTIDSILQDLNHTFSVFDSSSLISKINQGQDSIVNEDFRNCFLLAKNIAGITGKSFEPTIAPLVNLWGFGPDREESISQKKIDSVLTFVNFDKINLDSDTLRKADGIILDFNAIAKGYAVDKILCYLNKLGYENCLVEIGGEVAVSGTKNGTQWQVGIQTPTETKEGAIESAVSFHLQNAAVATSGNYRNYREEDGQRFSHIINPKTGHPEKSNLLSVSVIAKDCADADALATAFMVMGMEKSMFFLQNHPEYAAYFIYAEQSEFRTLQTTNFPTE